MSKSLIDDLVRQLQTKISALKEQASRSSVKTSPLLDDMLDEIQAALDELQLADEELHQQTNELQAAYVAIQRERERYHDLFEFAPDAYLITNLAGVIQEANLAAAQLFNVEPIYLPRKPLSVFIPLDDRPKYRSMLLTLRQIFGTQTAELHIQPRNRERVTVAVKIAPVIAQSNEVISLRWLLRDISKNKQMEKDLFDANTLLEARVQERTKALEATNAQKEALLTSERAARLEAERANAIKMRFLAMISHELRTPLASIKGFASTLLAQDVEWHEEQWKQFVDIIEIEADKLTDLVEQLLDLSRLQAGTLKIALKPVAFPDIIGNAESQLNLLTANHKFNITIQDDIPLVLADRYRIAQVLTNLVGNAAKFSPPDSTIDLSAEKSGDMLLVRVCDQGSGIPEEKRDKIFEAFNQLEGSSQRTGMGLGLAICKGLIEGHGGALWVEDSSPAGTTFAFTLKGVPANFLELTPPDPPSPE